MPFTQQQGLAIPFHFWRNSRTYFKILKFSLKSSPIPGSFIRKAHPLCISSVTHPFTSRLHGPTAHCGLQKSSPQRRQAKAETQGGLEHDEWNWWCSPLLIHHPVSEPHLPYPHSLYAPREGERERCAGRGSSHCSRGVAQGSSINALVWPQLLQHIYTALELERSELSLVGNKFLNKNLSSLFDMRIKLINAENYCIVKLQQWGHCENYWIFIQLIFLEEF